MRLDLHNHTEYSPDSRVSARALVQAAVRRGLQGIAITDHNAVGGVAAAESAARDGFLVLPGTEVSTRDGHVLAYGVRETIPRDLPVVETVERIVALGGVPVAAHPYRFWSGLGEDLTQSTPFRAYETANARTLRRGNVRARALAQARGIGETGGSDSHFLHEVGEAVTLIDDGASGTEGILQALGQGRTRSDGRSRGAGATARYVTKCVGEWMLRGMRRI
jgi:hypothetical protein